MVAITETCFTMGQVSIHMVDIGGQQSEHKKWIHNFESVTRCVTGSSKAHYLPKLTNISL